ncbi:MAG TPA: M1 family metallopeptidase [Solirubrobacterales bacterium]
MTSMRILLPLAVLGLAAPATAQAEIGSPGLGDPYYPNAGNGGYDVASYDLDLDYSPKSRRLEGVAVIAATAEVGLERFNLDLRPRMKARSVAVDGAEAGAEATGSHELEITPATPIAAGSQFTVEVVYGGKPKPVKDPDGTTEGWIATNDGAFAPNEPQGSPSWYPCNDHPSDKALFSISLTAPKGLQAISNGELLGREKSGKSRTWNWRETQPMATYLATAAIGRFDITRSDEAPAPSLFAVDPAVVRRTKSARRKIKPLERTPNVTRFLARYFGAYPFGTNGGIVDRVPAFPYALETQTRPIYTELPSELLVVHEIAHQWFGDSLTPADWHQIWLNEGFATYAEFLWEEERGKESAAKIFDQLYRTPADDDGFWNPPPGNPGDAKDLFAHSVYTRGAMTLQALREKLGDDVFFSILRDWVAEQAYGNVTTDEFIALAERESGRELDDFFQVWLFEPGKPRDW